MSSQKEWNFNFGIYANDDSLIEVNKCDELMKNIITWVEKNNFSCGGGFSIYLPNSDHYDSFYDEEKVKEAYCSCSNPSAMVMMSRYTNNPLVCFHCNNNVLPKQLKIGVDSTVKLQQWQNVYNSIDKLWLDSGAYESWAISELSSVKSAVNQQGFRVQKMLQKYRKTYYWWFQNVGSSISSLSNCPKCTKVLEKEDDKLICNECLLVMQSEW